MASTYQRLSAPNLHGLELADWSVGNDPNACGRISLPISAADGVTNTLVYLEVDPGNHIPLHTHSADETIVILEGSARATGALTTTFDEPVAPFGTSTFVIPLQQ